MQNHAVDRSSHLTGEILEILGGYYTALSYGVIYDVFVLFIFAKVKVIWFDTLVSDQSLAHFVY